MLKYISQILFCLLLSLHAVPSLAGSLPDGFVYLGDVIPDIQQDVRYFSENNFIGERINGYEKPRVIISEQAATALQAVQAELKSFALGMKVYDAYRPQQAVDHFVRWAKDIADTRMKQQYYPGVDKKDLFKNGYIAARSGHSRGSTVDLTIVSLGAGTPQELDMGTPWDFFSPLSWPGSTEVNASQRANRMLLREVMTKHGFKPLKEEWWHFTLADEPYPDTYFDFVVE